MTISHQLGLRLNSLIVRLARFRKDEAGATAVAMAIMSPILIGGMALGGETGYWYYTQRKLQHAADVAAHAAGVRKRVGESGASLRVSATQVAAASGFIPQMEDTNSDPDAIEFVATNLTLNNPPVSGKAVGDTNAVEIILTETKPPLLSSIFLKQPVQIKARAVAKLFGNAGSPACVLALSDTRSKAVEVSGNTSVTLNNCSIAVNSVQSDAYYMPNSTAELTADCISTVGGASIKDTTHGVLELKVCGSVQENAPRTLDPYAGVPEPDISGYACETNGKLKGNVYPKYVHPIYGPFSCYSNGIDIEANTTVTFSAGLYVIKGGTMKVADKAIVNANKATFYFDNNTTAQISGQAELNMTAPTSGMFAGLVFFGERCDPDIVGSCDEVFKITGNSSSSILGAIYLPGSTVEFLGNTNASTTCLQIISDTVTFTGNSDIVMGAACEGMGTATIMAGQIVKLIE